ncbi:MAG: rRNA pseudouridine synthase [Bacteroidia bacterium]|nr:rRNA pseudouridine synthase [Bacteroidia bacterium]
MPKSSAAKTRSFFPSKYRLEENRSDRLSKKDKASSFPAGKGTTLYHLRQRASRRNTSTQTIQSNPKLPTKNLPAPGPPELPQKIRLVRYVALSGVASRREAVKVIKNGQVTVNGQVVREPWVYVNVETDKVTYRGQPIRPEKPVYILLNKPKNTICTLRDERGRPTVMDLLEGAPKVRLYPVGRLDRNTTGILILTNDGDLTQKLLHPKSQVPRVYRATTVKPMTKAVVEKLLEGVPLPDGVAQADKVVLEDPYTLLITIHIGRKHIVRRMLEYLGYRLKSLDRIAFGPITRKGVRRGQWRYLTAQEVGWLKMLPDPRKKPT